MGEQLICRACHGHRFNINYEATYVYSYEIDNDAPGLHNSVEFLPYQYDRREQQEARQYLECRTCGQKYPCYFNDWDKQSGLQELQAIIDSGYSPSQTQPPNKRPPA